MIMKCGQQKEMTRLCDCLHILAGAMWSHLPPHVAELVTRIWYMSACSVTHTQTVQAAGKLLCCATPQLLV